MKLHNTWRSRHVFEMYRHVFNRHWGQARWIFAGYDHPTFIINKCIFDLEISPVWKHMCSITAELRHEWCSRTRRDFRLLHIFPTKSMLKENATCSSIYGFVHPYSFYKKEFFEKFFIFSSGSILNMSLILQHQQSPPQPAMCTTIAHQVSSLEPVYSGLFFKVFFQATKDSVPALLSYGSNQVISDLLLPPGLEENDFK